MGGDAVVADAFNYWGISKNARAFFQQNNA
jgi:hypothetical protein